MAYDRYDTTDERSRWQRDRSSGDSDRNWDRERGHRSDHQERGLFERTISARWARSLLNVPRAHPAGPS